MSISRKISLFLHSALTYDSPHLVYSKLRVNLNSDYYIHRSKIDNVTLTSMHLRHISWKLWKKFGLVPFIFLYIVSPSAQEYFTYRTAASIEVGVNQAAHGGNPRTAGEETSQSSLFSSLSNVISHLNFQHSRGILSGFTGCFRYKHL